MTPTQAYNRATAWRGHYGGGLAACGNPFAALDPASAAFEVATRELQQLAGLQVDGRFGPKTIEAYRVRYGAPSLCAHGVDVSGWQLEDDQVVDRDDDDEVDFERLEAEGFLFAWIKLAQGTSKRTRRSKAHAADALRAKFLRGFYTFATPYSDGSHDALQEVEHFMRLLERESFELKPVIDLEDKGYSVDESDYVTRGKWLHDMWKKRRDEYKKRMTDWLEVWLTRYHELMGSYPILYSYPSYLRQRIDPDVGSRCDLWLAAYTLDDPRDVYEIDPRYRLVCQQWTSSGDERSRRAVDIDLDLNRAPWGVGPLRR